MKRLTMKDENGCFLTDKTATVTWNSLIGKNRYRGEAVDRLAAYEDTGLEPEEISKIREDVENGYLKSTARRYGVSVDRLRELAEADREGRCVVLPRLEPGQGDNPGEPGAPGPPGIATVATLKVREQE